jgi:hypothetical protein
MNTNMKMTRTMKTSVTLCGILVALSISTLAFAALPGTPLDVWSTGTLDIYDGGIKLPGPVVEGDLVLQESVPPPLGNPDRATWSDVVRFFNAPNPVNGQNTGYAFLISDGENGVGNIGITFVAASDLGFRFDMALPDALNNNTFLQEGPMDPTFYQPTTLTYRIHSDVDEAPEPGEKVLQPGALLSPGNLFVVVGETSGAEQPFSVVFPGGIQVLPGGPVTIFETGGVAISDYVSFTNNSISVDWSDPLGPELGGDDPYIVIDPEGDNATFATYLLLDGPEVPEPTTLVLLGIGAIGLLARRRQAA